MIELIVTCILSGLFVPPQGWTVVEVFVKDPYSWNMTAIACMDGKGNMTSCPDREPYIKLRRIVQPGEIVQPPKNCSIEATRMEKK